MEFLNIELIERLFVWFGSLTAAWLGIQKFLLSRFQTEKDADVREREVDLKENETRRNELDYILQKTVELEKRQEEQAEKYKNLYEREHEKTLLLEKKLQELSDAYEKTIQELTEIHQNDLKSIQDLEERLRVLERKTYVIIHRDIYANLWNESNVGWALVSYEGRVLKSNDFLNKFLGYSSHELHNKHFAEITAVEDVAPDVNNFAKLTDGEILHYTQDKKYTHKEGHLILGRLDVYYLEEENFVLGRVIPLN